MLNRDQYTAKEKAHAARHSVSCLTGLLAALPASQRPRLVRGDIAFGNDLVMGELEAMAQPCLFKLRQSPGVRRLIERQWQNDDWQDVGEGYHAVEARLTLSGWAADRRVVVVRRAVKQSLAVALVYNWWSWYVRLAHPRARLEAITSRPLLFAGIARETSHAGQSRLLVSLTHACAGQIKSMITNVRTGLGTILASTPQLPKPERWRALVRYIISKILPRRLAACRT